MKSESEMQDEEDMGMSRIRSGNHRSFPSTFVLGRVKEKRRPK